jgi:multimeric flavodoxin WrbA
MLILGIYGSPRKAGNTDAMLDAFLAGALGAGADIQRLYVRDLEINPCIGCGHCDKFGTCIQKDAMADVYPQLEQADAIVVASPIYFYGVTAQLKMLIDRSQALFMKRDLAKKAGTYAVIANRKGFLLSAAATRGKRLFECAILTVKYFFEALDVQYAGELCFPEIDERKAIQKHATALEECRKSGYELAHSIRV